MVDVLTIEELCRLLGYENKVVFVKDIIRGVVSRDDIEKFRGINSFTDFEEDEFYKYVRTQVVVDAVLAASYKYDTDMFDIFVDEATHEIVIMYHSDNNSFAIENVGVKENEVDWDKITSTANDLDVGIQR